MRQRIGSAGPRPSNQRQRLQTPTIKQEAIVLSDSEEDSDVVEVVEQVFSSTFPLTGNGNKRARGAIESRVVDDRPVRRQRQSRQEDNSEIEEVHVHSISQPVQTMSNAGVVEETCRSTNVERTRPIEYPQHADPLPIESAELDTIEPEIQPANNAFIISVTEPTPSNSPGNERPPALDTNTQPLERQMYLQIFDRIQQTVMHTESHLFSPREQQTLVEFSNLDRHSRYLYTRIFMRKQAWLRTSSLNYGEQMVIDQSCKYLTNWGPTAEPFLHSEEMIDNCEDALSLLLLPELKTLAKTKGIKQVSKPKEFLCAALLKTLKQRTVTSFFQKNKGDSVKQRQDEFIKAVLEVTGPVVRLNPLVSELFERLHLVFFRSATHLGDSNSIKSAVLSEIGQIRFPSYSVVRSPDLFASRDAVVQYKQLVEVGYSMEVLLTSLVKETEQHMKGWQMFVEHQSAWHALLETLRQSPTQSVGGIELMSRVYWRRHFTAGWALARIAERGARFAANTKQFAKERDVLESLLSQDAFRLGKRGEWHERIVLLHTAHLRPKGTSVEARAQTAEALERAKTACVRALDDVHVNRISLHAISRQLRCIETKLQVDPSERIEHPRLCVEWQMPVERIVYGMRVRNIRRGPSVWDGMDGIPCSVEQLALWRYQELGYTGIHSENAMVTTLFVLLFWDIVFCPLPGVLDTEYQSQPLDMGSESFYFSRQAMIEHRLAEIANGQFVQSIREVYEKQHGVECVGVSWDLPCDQLQTVATYMGGQRLSAVCRVLATEFRLKRSGFPDLCLWNSQTKHILFAEVKGPKDKLSETQRDWLNILVTNNIDVEVCHVRDGDARDTDD
ncbi:hypothetical protein GGH96_000048 [Coemansia sp. RSA 1972]|nr:hypothetical protein GGH96_000048 [Coemansia sp. RSA 1972]